MSCFKGMLFEVFAKVEAHDSLCVNSTHMNDLVSACVLVCKHFPSLCLPPITVLCGPLHRETLALDTAIDVCLRDLKKSAAV